MIALFKQLRSTEQPRYLWLVGGALVCLMLWQATRAVVIHPMQLRLATISQLKRKIHNAEFAVARGQRAARLCSDAAIRSIAADPAITSHRYQEWLLKRTEPLGKIQVASAIPIVEPGIGHRIVFTIEGQATLVDVTDLIDEIQRTPLMHRISYFNVSKEREGRESGDEVQFTLNLEVLAMTNAGNLPAVPPPLPLINGGNLSQLVATRKPFDRGYFGPVVVKKSDSDLVAASPPPPRPRIDPLKSLKLVGSVNVDGKPLAWLNDSRTQDELSLALQQAFHIYGFRAKVSQVDRDYIELTTDKGRVRWPLGSNLRDALTLANIPDDGLDVGGATSH